MLTTLDYLDQLKASNGLPSDYAVAAKLGITRAQVSKYRHKKDYFSQKTALTVAEMLGIPSEAVFVSVAAERAKDAKEVAVWEAVYNQINKPEDGSGGLSCTTGTCPAVECETSADCILCKTVASHTHRVILH